MLYSVSWETLTKAPVSQINPAAWQGQLASIYGGINEEIMMRQFLISYIVLTFHKIKKISDDKPTAPGVYLARILTAVLFGIVFSLLPVP